MNHRICSFKMIILSLVIFGTIIECRFTYADLPIAPEPDLQRIESFQKAGLMVQAVQQAEQLAATKSLPLEMNLWLSECYSKGVGVNTDPARAAFWLQKAAEQGNDEAMCKLGDIFEHGYGVDKDLKIAASWYLRSANSGNQESETKWAGIVLLNTNAQFQRDSSAALARIKSQAYKGAQASFILGRLYMDGKWVEKNPEEAAKLFEFSAKQGYASASTYYGLALINGDLGVKDVTGGIAWITKSASIEGEAAVILAKYLETGIYVPRDRKRALALYARGAKQGLAEAMAGQRRIERHFKSPEVFGAHIYGVMVDEIIATLSGLNAPLTSRVGNTAYFDSTALMPGSSVLACRGIDGPVGFIGEMLYRFDPKIMLAAKVTTAQLIERLQQAYPQHANSKQSNPIPGAQSAHDLIQATNAKRAQQRVVNQKSVSILWSWRDDATTIQLRKEQDGSSTLQYRFEPFFSDLVANQKKHAGNRIRNY